MQNLFQLARWLHKKHPHRAVPNCICFQRLEFTALWVNPVGGESPRPLTTGKAGLVYAAMMEGKVAGLHAAGKRETKMNYDLVSNIIFSHPEIGTVGITEAEAKAQGLDVITVKTPMEDIGKAVAIGEIDGFVKMIAERPSGRIVGLHILGPHATDIM